MIGLSVELSDPFLARKLAWKCFDHFGSGFNHGDLTLDLETYEAIAQFILDELEDKPYKTLFERTHE